MKDNNNVQEYKNIPVSVLIQDLRNKMSKAISTSRLPAAVLELIFKEFYMDLKHSSEQIYQLEKTEYEKSLKEPAQKN